MPKTCELRCRFCQKRWESDEIEDAPHWGVLYTICATCYPRIFEEFERQFPTRGRIIRIEDRRDR